MKAKCFSFDDVFEEDEEEEYEEDEEEAAGNVMVEKTFLARGERRARGLQEGHKRLSRTSSAAATATAASSSSSSLSASSSSDDASSSHSSGRGGTFVKWGRSHCFSDEGEVREEYDELTINKRPSTQVSECYKELQQHLLNFFKAKRNPGQLVLSAFCDARILFAEP